MGFSMRRKKILCGAGVVLLIAGAFVTGHSAGAASKEPGSTGDPLVTLSYLESRLGESAGVSEKLQLKKGERLLGEPGSSIIVLGGSVTAAGTGLVDVTEGCLAEEDTSLFLYHCYIASEKNSGCEALSAATVLVSGDYKIK